MDDIMIHSKTRAEHLKLLGEVFEHLRQNQLFLKASKCHWLQDKVE